ncbi:MAG: hypothetical protein GXX79_22655 [Actinomycetales bacterium]|nr:hypothetical protein [Actinomycetales bacterium]
MFGLITPCQRAMGAELGARYREVMCGTCLALDAGAGHAARAAVTTDVLVLGLLCEDLAEAGGRHRRVDGGRCPLRGMRRAPVLDPQSALARFLAAVCVQVLQIGLGDHAADRDRGALGARLLRPVVGRWSRRTTDAAPVTTTVVAGLRECAERDRRTEGTPGLTVEEYLEATEDAFAQVFAAVADLVGREGIEHDLQVVGRRYGRIAVLVDALDDHARDRRRGSFNVLAAGLPDADPDECVLTAGRLLTAALDDLGRLLDRLGVGHRGAAGHLLHHALSRRVALAVASFRDRYHLDQPRATGRRRDRHAVRAALVGLTGLAPVLGLAPVRDTTAACCGCGARFCATGCCPDGCADDDGGRPPERVTVRQCCLFRCVTCCCCCCTGDLSACYTCEGCCCSEDGSKNAKRPVTRDDDHVTWRVEDLPAPPQDHDPTPPPGPWPGGPTHRDG